MWKNRSRERGAQPLGAGRGGDGRAERRHGRAGDAFRPRRDRVEILDERGAAALGKPRGKYYTLELASRFERGAESFPDAAAAVAELISRCAGDFGDNPVLIAALGNRDEAARKSFQSVVAAAPESPQGLAARQYLAQLGGA